jgi:hypothetical protein
MASIWSCLLGLYLYNSFFVIQVEMMILMEIF